MIFFLMFWPPFIFTLFPYTTLFRSFYGLQEICNDKETMKKIGLETGIAGKNVIIQGLGNVGYNAAKYFYQAGAKITCLVEYDGAIYNPKGLNPIEVQKFREEHGTILGFAGSRSEERR